MLKVKVTDPQTGKITMANVPESWADIPLKSRISYAEKLFSQPRETVLVAMLKAHSGLPNKLWFRIAQKDIAAMLSQMEAIGVAASPAPIVPYVDYKFNRYYLPKIDFDNGSAGEFIIALDHYRAYAESKDKADLLRLFATLARVRRRDGRDSERGGDIREPIFDNTDTVERRAALLHKMPMINALVVLRYFEGVCRLVSEVGEKLGVWNTLKDEGAVHPVNLFGWRTILRGMAEGDVQRYDALTQRKFWEVLELLAEKQAQLDYIESQTKAKENAQ